MVIMVGHASRQPPREVVERFNGKVRTINLSCVKNEWVYVSIANIPYWKKVSPSIVSVEGKAVKWEKKGYLLYGSIDVD